ncbi:glycosyltransferase family 4 protein [Ottowia thiooxydans]|uniref:glycosyltransferase family 4 protein n=1 Tax=Ottowia thiooxydans TaxID=219182 RepID=UPI0009FFFB50|nr:glycosyltransferase family 4 protein [Ottowia thiooxydans]
MTVFDQSSAVGESNGTSRSSPPMRVAITNPFVWPHVRRGSERLLNDLAIYLYQAGHHVDVFAMGPDDAEENRGGVHYHLFKERWTWSRRQLNSLHYFAFHLPSVLAHHRLDVVFCLNYFDAYAALRCRDKHDLNYKVIFLNVGIPTRRYFRAVPLDWWFMHKVLQQADQCLVLSEFAHRSLQEEFGVASVIMPPPVVTDAFSQPPRLPTASEPTLLFVGDVDEPRKGAKALCAAFARLKFEIPALRLRFVGRVSPETQSALLALVSDEPARQSIEFLGVGDVATLPALYQSSSVTVLPSVWEAFGLVLVESLAAGTPVVGARHGGISDIVQDQRVGALFDPEPFTLQTDAVDALVDALRQVLARGKTADIVAACRARAEYFSWKTQGPAYVRLIESFRPT